MSDIANTAAPIYLLIAPDPQFITLGTVNLAATPQVLSVSSALNIVGNQGAVIQNTASAQPGWSATSTQGPHLATSGGHVLATSISGSTGTAGVPGFTFNGTSQFFEYDTLASTFSGTEVGVTVTCVVQANSSASGPFTVWAFSSASGTTALSLSFQSGNVVLTTTNGSTTATVSSVGTGLCLVTATRVATSISLRVWTNVGTLPQGTPTLTTATHAISPISETYTTFAIGAQVNTSGTGTNFFNGTMQKLAVYGVSPGTSLADIEEVETEFLLTAGLARLTDIATVNASGSVTEE